MAHTCDECGQRFASSGGLDIHVDYVHAAPPPPVEPSLPPVAAVAGAPPRQALSGVIQPTRPDPTFPIAIGLVVALFLAGIAAVVHPPRPSKIVTVAATAPLPSTFAGPSSAQPEIERPSSDACAERIDAVNAAPSTRRSDIATVVRGGTLEPLPLPGHERPVVAETERYTSVDEFMANAVVVDPAAFRGAMTAGGFQQSDHAQYRVAGSSYSADVYRFSSPAGAAGFHRATLRIMCASGLMAEPRVLDALAGGFAYHDLRSTAPRYVAVFLAGDSLVRLRVCECVASADDFALVANWAVAVASAVSDVSR